MGEGDFAPLRVIDAELTNLLAPPTRMIGRDEEAARVGELLGDAYAAAFTEWADDSANDAWDNTVVDS